MKAEGVLAKGDDQQHEMVMSELLRHRGTSLRDAGVNWLGRCVSGRAFRDVYGVDVEPNRSVRKIPSRRTSSRRSRKPTRARCWSDKSARWARQRCDLTGWNA
jgi:hypothetical protein